MNIVCPHGSNRSMAYTPTEGSNPEIVNKSRQKRLNDMPAKNTETANSNSLQGLGATLPFASAFLGALAVVFFDVFLTKGSTGTILSWPTLSAVGGFSGIIAWTTGVLMSLSQWTLSRPKRGRVLGFVLESLPFSLPLAMLATTLFEGGMMRTYAFGGLGPIFVFLVGTIAVTITSRSWRNWTEIRTVHGMVLLLAFGGLIFFVDRTYYVGLYPGIHQVLSFTVFATSAIVAQRTLRHLPSRKICQGLTSLALVGACWITFFLFQGPPAPRALLFEDLSSTRSICGLWWFKRPSVQEVNPSALSLRFQNWETLRDKSRQELSGLRGGKKFNLLFVSVDAVRRDHTTLHGYKRNTTPFLEELAEKSFVFDDARSPSTSSFFSLMSILSGSYPSGISLSGGQEPDLLGRSLHSAGYTSLGIYTDAVFTARPNHWPRPDLRLGQDVYEFNTTESKKMIGRVLEAVSTIKSPFFLFTHLMDPHAPYRKHDAFDFGSRDIDRYDSEVAFADSQLRRLFIGLEEQELLESTVVVITSDHGEAFGEHGAFLHGGLPHEEQCRVPLLIFVPYMEGGKLVQGSVSLTSLAPTLVDLLGSRKLANSEAASLAPLMLGHTNPEDYYAVSERPSIHEDEDLSSVTTLVQGKYKFRAQYEAGLRTLYDLEKDSLEKNDISQSDPKAFTAMSQLFREWQSDCVFKRHQGHNLNPQFNALRDEILLGSNDEIPLVFDFLKMEDQTVQIEAALLLFDLEVEGRIPGSNGLCSFEANKKDKTLIGLQDLLGARREKRPFRQAAALLTSTNVILRRRAAWTLWDLYDLPFAPVIAKVRLPQEKDPQTRADLLGVLARNQEKVDIPELLKIATKMKGPPATRLLISLMTRQEEAIETFIEETISQEDSPLAHTLIRYLGASDTPRRRKLVTRLLRLDRYTLRASTVEALKTFPPSPWLASLFRRLILHEPHRVLRLKAAKLLATYPGDQNAQAMLTSLGTYPGSALGMGYLLANHHKQAIENWSLKETDLKLPLQVGEVGTIDIDTTTPQKQYARRLIATIVKRERGPSISDRFQVWDAGGTMLLDQPCSERTQVICLNLIISRKTIKLPLSLRFIAPKRKNTKDLGVMLATIIPLMTPFELWPAEMTNLDQVGILQRFSPGWRTTMTNPDLCFMPQTGGSLMLKGAQEEKSTATVQLITAKTPCLIEISMFGEDLGTFKLAGGRIPRTIHLKGINRRYRKKATNQFDFAIKPLPGGTLPIGTPGDTVALKTFRLN